MVVVHFLYQATNTHVFAIYYWQTRPNRKNGVNLVHYTHDTHENYHGILKLVVEIQEQQDGSKPMGVSKNNGTPKSSILIGFSSINHPYWGTPIFGNTPMRFPIFTSFQYTPVCLKLVLAIKWIYLFHRAILKSYDVSDLICGCVRFEFVSSIPPFCPFLVSVLVKLQLKG